MTASDRIKARYIPDGMTVYRVEKGGIVYASPDQLHGVAWRGTSMKHEWYYSFRTPEMLKQRSDMFFESVQANQKRMDERHALKTAFKTTLKPGDILNTSWGYDQTNVEFFQVLTVKNNTITIQEICGTYESTGSMAGRTLPIPNKPRKVNVWVDDVDAPNGRRCDTVDTHVLSKRVTLGGCVKIHESASASLWNGKSCYTSSYA